MNIKISLEVYYNKNVNFEGLKWWTEKFECVYSSIKCDSDNLDDLNAIFPLKVGITIPTPEL